MSKRIFNETQQRILERNEAVQAVTDRTVSFTPEFKIKAVKEYQQGKSPTDIFVEQGLDLDLIGPKIPKQCLSRWKSTYAVYGEAGFFTERRGKGSTGRPSVKDQSTEKRLEKAEARIKYLEAELELLKKLEELERQARKRH
jgi:transposase